MTTREIYFQAYMISDKPLGKIYYTQMVEDLEVPMHTGWIKMHRDWHEKNIELMQDLETQEGFMFWNLSPECDVWLEFEGGAQRKIIAAFVFEQR